MAPSRCQRFVVLQPPPTLVGVRMGKDRGCKQIRSAMLMVCITPARSATSTLTSSSVRPPPPATSVSLADPSSPSLPEVRNTPTPLPPSPPLPPATDVAPLIEARLLPMLPSAALNESRPASALRPIGLPSAARRGSAPCFLRSRAQYFACQPGPGAPSLHCQSASPPQLQGVPTG